MSIAEGRRRPTFGFHHRLVLARETAGLNQAQMAEVIDVSRPTVSSYENGLTKPRRLQVRAWAMACGVDYEWLEHGEAHGPNGPEGFPLPDLDSNQEPAGIQSTLAEVIVLRPSTWGGTARVPEATAVGA